MSDWCGWPVVGETTAWEAAQQTLADAELSDGLPLVPPTRRRLDAMIAGVSGRAESQGMMPPMFGDITPDSVAYQCVIAGCRPAELPVVVAMPSRLKSGSSVAVAAASTTFISSGRQPASTHW